MAKLQKRIHVILLDEAEEYLEKVNPKMQIKILKSIQKTENGFRGKWFKKLKSSDGIFEFRETDHKYFYRLLAFWDNSKSDKTLILSTHGFDKKTNKTPKREIQKAERLKKDYFKKNSK
ncbi:MAG TPA: type II toxin-antitoxin system RelE/ParE family toxin [Ignavibacteria bacterium]|nr:type II toxin-antitoxin system RelE/ParE family toxin [Ignavibacteria bacterium]